MYIYNIFLTTLYFDIWIISQEHSGSEIDVKFAPEDLALATVPGVDFDPRERSFAIDELKPQPIIRKRPKIFVAENSKDDKYWEKRIKNNVAARRYIQASNNVKIVFTII